MIFRLTRGRIGLWRPKPDKGFGVMGLSTTGRRTGASRLVMVGYVDDGPNLVTLAMNGWADTQPAWWLNLQANPEAIALLANGSSTVQARVAIGHERERLWAKIADYPGWGEDLDALASRRLIETPVVIFAPGPSEQQIRELTASTEVSDRR